MKIADGSYKIGRSDGTEGWWGLGATGTDRPAPDWQCPHHEGKTAKGDSVHFYDDGDEACTTCARAWLVSIGESVSDPDKFEPVVCRIPVPTGANGRGAARTPVSQKNHKRTKQGKLARVEPAPSIPPRSLGPGEFHELELFAGVS